MALGLLLADCVSCTCLCTLGWAFSLGWARQDQAGLGRDYPKHASGYGSLSVMGILGLNLNCF